MTIDPSLLYIDPEEAQHLSADELKAAMSSVLDAQKLHRKENAILYYEPVSETAWQVHQSTAKICGVSGGNRSSKTESCIAEIVMLATGMMPERFRTDPVFRSKFRGPIQVRIVVESLINTLWPAILPKFQWFKWLGTGTPGGDMGHWGWLPKSCLVKQDWDKSFSKTERCLRMICRDPDNPKKVLGESTIHFMSKDNDPEDFASGEFHIVLEDEPPTEAIHRENQTRVQSVNGRILLAMTWPDDPTIPVTWIFDEVYEPGSPGPNKHPQIDWFELDSRDNAHTMKEGLEFNMSQWSQEMIAVRVRGEPMRMSSRVHPLFTDRTSWWCFICNQECYVEDISNPLCKGCGNKLVASYLHVRAERPQMHCPVVYVLDPHPRKPHMMIWVAVTPEDDYFQLAECQVEGTPGQVHEKVTDIEREMKMDVRVRLMDPNMGASAPGVRRGITWQSEFSEVGLRCNFADDSGAGQQRVNELLRPDRDTFRPRMQVHESCSATIRQFKRYQWDNYKVGAEKGLKEVPRAVDDDFPTLWKYLANYNPNFRYLRHGAPIIGKRQRSAS
jgi:hypothetical protein